MAMCYDPINFNDRRGLFACTVGTAEGQEVTDCEIDVIVIGDTDSSKAQEIHQRQLERIRKRLQRSIARAIKTLAKHQKCWNLLTGEVASIDPVALLDDTERLGFEIVPLQATIRTKSTSAIATASLLKPVDIGNGATQLQKASVSVTISDSVGSFAHDRQKSQKK